MKRVFFQWNLLVWGIFALSMMTACQGVTKENFGQSLWEENCRFVHEKCCSGKTLSDSVKSAYGSDMTACLANFSKELNFGILKINYKNFFDSLAKNETMSFNGGKASQCLDSLKSISCVEGNNSLALKGACDGVYVGTLTEGKACDGSMFCAPGFSCRTDAENKQTCKKLAAEGESCQSNSCDDNKGLYCDFKESKCKVAKKQGEACDGSTQCQTGLSCKDQKCVVETTPAFCN